MPPEKLDFQAPLPIALRGYAREPVDELLAEAEKKYSALVRQRDELRDKLADARRRLSSATDALDDRSGQEQTLAEAVRNAEQLEEKCRILTAERDELKASLAGATKDLNELAAQVESQVERQRAIAEALIAAEQLKAQGADRAEAIEREAMREAARMRESAEEEARRVRESAELDAAAIRDTARLEAGSIASEVEASRAALDTELDEVRARAEAEADALLRSARQRADRLVEEVQQNLEEQQRQAEDFFDGARSKLGSLLQDLFDQLGSVSEPEPTELDRVEAD